MGIHKIIQLNPEYKIEQLAREIINTSESEIVIEVPENCSLLTNEINLRLLKFYAEEEEKEIIINGVEPGLISLAQRLGISTVWNRENPVSEAKPAVREPQYPSEAQNAAITETRDARSLSLKPSQYSRLIPALVLLFFTLIMAIWWFLQPKATIMIYPKVQTLAFKTAAKTAIAFTDADIIHGNIPAEVLTQNFTVTSQTVTTGHKVIGITAAIGKIMIINGSNQPILLLKGSTLDGRNGIHFQTDKDVLIPKKETKTEMGIIVGESYGKAEVTIIADRKGTDGNQPAKSITAVEGKYRNLLKVTNPLPTHDGIDQQVAIVDLNDVKKGEDEAGKQMQLSFGDQAHGLVNKDYLYFQDLAKTEIIHVTSKPDIGAESDSLETDIEYQIKVLAPTTVGIQKFLKGKFERVIPAHFEAQDSKVTLVSMQLTHFNDESARLELEGQGQIRGLLNSDKIKNLIKGKPIAEAKAILTRQSEIADAKFQLEGYRTALPNFGFQIRILFPAGSKTNQPL
ncbi:MAG TPA: hypothetical protein DDW50_00520 [Firmicutes bacterium]|nr:hypothetical protein [Bacillota bacterium]